MSHLDLFANNLRFLMDEKSLNQTQLSKATGISNQAISLWLQSKRQPLLENLWTLADFFDCSVDYLIGRSDSV